jgi:prepilin-type N-terminal cleavage/methylation domain-containing protein/prepilin-type processing-associated H-X9-DG protein
MAHNRQIKQGFTLLELLTVVAIIAVLCSILIPALGGVRESAQQARCASNMRQIGCALLLCAAANDNKLPETSHTAAVGQSWIYTLSDYLGDCDEVRICPADPKGDSRFDAGGTSYILNSFLFVPQIGPFGQPMGGPSNNLTLIESPAEVPMAFIISDSKGVSDWEDHTHSSRWGSWSAVVRDISPGRFGGGNSPIKALGNSNYLFADGHVEQVDAAIMKARIDSGDNFAKPR